MMKRGLKTLKLAGSKQAKKAAYLQRGAIYYGKGSAYLGQSQEAWELILEIRTGLQKDHRNVCPGAIPQALQIMIKCAYCFPIPPPWLFQFSYSCLITG